ncbi:hypothetical protein EOL06_21440 [Escherichia coli]|nr:hypothetical protein EOL06_21440 [Escherichia coli]
MCCDAGTLVPALVLWNPALPMALVTFPLIFLLWLANRLSPFPDQFVIPFLLFITGITPLLACLPACLHRFSKIRKGVFVSVSDIRRNG